MGKPAGYYGSDYGRDYKVAGLGNKRAFVSGDCLMFNEGGSTTHEVDVRFEPGSATVIIGCIRVSLEGWLLLRQKVQKAVSEGV